MNKLALSLRQTEGFTLVEVLVGVLLTLTFVGISTQAFVISTMFKVRGQELSEATTWIQQDLENLRFEASRLNVDAGKIQNTGQHDIKCSASDAITGYADWLRDEIRIQDGDTAATSNNSSKDLDKASTIGNRPYILRRVVTPSTTAPFNVLEVRYAVYDAAEEPTNQTDTTDADAIATQYADIIPNASFACQ